MLQIHVHHILRYQDYSCNQIVPSGLFSGPRNKVRDEALGALVSLGFDKIRCEKTVDQIISKSPEELPVETLIKQALKQL